MKKWFNNFIWLVFSIILLVSCCKDDNYYNLSDEELSLLPYKINDTVVLKNLQNDTFAFFCDKITNEYFCEKNRTPFCDNNDCDQRLEVLFVSNDSSTLNLKMNASLDSKFARMYLELSNSEELSIYNTIHKIIDTIYVNEVLYTNVYRFKHQSKDKQFYIKPGKGLIKIKSNDIIYELIE